MLLVYLFKPRHGLYRFSLGKTTILRYSTQKRQDLHPRYPHSKFCKLVTFIEKRTGGDQNPKKAVLGIKLITPDDEYRQKLFIESLSPETRRHRFFAAKRSLSPAELFKFTHTDFIHDFALAAVNEVTDTFVSTARFMTPQTNQQTCEVAILVHDDYQGMGIGSYVLNYLLNIARIEKKKTALAEVLITNKGAHHLFGSFTKKYHTKISRTTTSVIYEMDLTMPLDDSAIEIQPN